MGKISVAKKFYFLLLVDIIYIFICAEIHVIVLSYCSRSFIATPDLVYLFFQYLLFGILASCTAGLKTKAEIHLNGDKISFTVFVVIIGFLAIFPLFILVEPLIFIVNLFMNTGLNIFIVRSEMYLFTALFPVLLIPGKKRSPVITSIPREEDK